MSLPSCFINFAKQVTYALTGDSFDFSQKSVSQGTSADFHYMNRQLSDLKDFIELLKHKKANRYEDVLCNELIRRYEAKNISEIGNMWSMAGTRTIPPNIENENIKIAIDGLTDVIVTLSIGCTPEEANVLSRYLAILQTLEAAYPGLTAAQKKTLDELPKNLGADLESVARPSFMKLYWQEVLAVYQQIQSNLYQSIQPLDDQITTINGDLASSENMNRLISQLYSTYRNFLNTSWAVPNPNFSNNDNDYTASLMEFTLGMSQLFSDIAVIYPQLPTSILTVFDTILNVFDKTLMVTPDNTLSNFLSYSVGYQICCGVKALNPGASGGDFKNAIINAANQYNSIPSLSNFRTALTSLGNSIGSGGLGNVTGSKIFVNQWTINNAFPLEYMQIASSKSLINSTGFQTFVNAFQSYMTSYDNAISDQQTRVEELQNSIESLKIDNQSFFPIMVESQENFVVAMPLQTSFASLILDKYLPEQEFYLKSIGLQLTFSDKACKYINQIVELCTNFQTADVYYSATIYLRQMNLAGIKNAIQNAKQVLADEITRCTADIARANKAINTITTIEDEIKADLDLTEVQKKELLDLMSTYSANFQSLIKNLGVLKSLVSSLAIKSKSDPDSTYEAFDIGGPEGWSRLLSFFESLVIDGGKIGVFYGGEQSIQIRVEADHSNYSDFNQNQQLALQLEMAAVQQEWTIVSNSLGIINQIYSGIARKIK